MVNAHTPGYFPLSTCRRRTCDIRQARAEVHVLLSLLCTKHEERRLSKYSQSLKLGQLASFGGSRPAVAVGMGCHAPGGIPHAAWA
jgi:hypothetical protein